jgi:hypothetical protein
MFTDDVIVYILFPVVAKLLFVFHVVQCPGGVETNKSHSHSHSHQLILTMTNSSLRVHNTSLHYMIVFIQYFALFL